MKNTIIKVLSIVMAMVMALGTCIVVTATAGAADCKHANYEQYGDPVAATCTTWGFTVYQCSDCKDHFKTELNTLEPPHVKLEGHKWLNEKTVKPTCIADGYTTKTCSICNTEDRYDIVAKGEAYHDWDKGVKTDSNCTDAGVMTYTCKTCGKTKTTAIDAKGHTWVAQLDKVIEPKCEDYVDVNDPDNKKAAYGYMPYKCKNCDATRTVEIMPRDHHVYVFMEKDTSGLCGTVYLSQAGKYCKWCYEDENGGEHAVIEHNWEVVAGKDYKEATCEEDGYRTVQCTICKKIVENQVIPAKHHEFGTVPTFSKAPTCTTWGYDLYGCIYCGTKFENVSHEPTGHKWAATGTKVDATCTTPGGIEYACENGCGETKIEADPDAPATGHNKTLKDVAAVEPTCLDGGYTAGKLCPDCNTYVEGHIALPALGHANVTYICTVAAKKDIVCSRCGYADPAKQNMDATITAGSVESHVWERDDALSVDPTCILSGADVLTCKYCGKTVTKTVPALGHKTETTTVDATCTTKGYKLVSCTVCLATISNVELPINPDGHIGEVLQYTAPTCTMSGVEVGNCANCSMPYTKTIAKLGHDQVNIAAKAATCTEDGNTEGSYCKRCNEVFKESKVLTKLGHDEKTIAGYAATCTTKGLSDGKECKRCGETTVKQVEIAKIDHYTNGVQYAGEGTDYTANCKTPSIGFDVHECDYCDEAYIDAYRDALDHTWGELQHKAVNCVEDGYDYYECTAVGCTAIKEVENTRVKAEGHKDKNGNVISTSCVRPADMDITCVNKFCPDSDKKIDVIHEDKFAGHVDATCLIYEHDIFVCTVCERKTVENIVDKLAEHKYKVTSQDSADPTFEKAKKIVKKCEVCAEEVTEYVTAGVQFKIAATNLSNADEKIVNGTKKVQVTIAVRGDKEEIHSFISAFTFNKDHLEFVSAECAKTIAGAAANIDAYNVKADGKDTGKVNITAFVSNNVDGDVVDATLTGTYETLVTLTFKVKGAAYGSAKGFNSSIAMTVSGVVVDSAEQAVTTDVTSATAKIAIYKLADVNGDGKIDNVDYLAIQKLVEGDKYDARADLNGDAKVSAEDLGLLQKVLVGRQTYNSVADARK